MIQNPLVLNDITGYASRTQSIYNGGGGGARSFVSGSGVVSGAVRNSGYTTAAAGSMVGQHVNTKMVKVPKRVTRQEVFEKTIVVPETRYTEEMIEEEQPVYERVIQLAKPVVEEEVVEVFEDEYVEKLIEVPQIIYQERLRHVPKVEVQEKVKHIPKIIRQEKIVEIPKIEYREVPVQRIVEVPEIREEIVIRERPVAQYVNKPHPIPVEVKVPYDVTVKVPVPVAAEINHEYEVPSYEPRIRRQKFPLYVPKFVEVPVPRCYVDDYLAGQAERLRNHVEMVTASGNTAPSLEQIHGIAEELRRSTVLPDLQRQIESPQGRENLIRRFQENRDLVVLPSNNNNPFPFSVRNSGRSRNYYPSRTTAPAIQRVSRTARRQRRRRYSSSSDDGSISSTISSCSTCQERLREIRGRNRSKWYDWLRR